MQIRNLSIIAFALLLGGCATSRPPRTMGAFNVGDILTQVNSAVEEARAGAETAPKIYSIRLDLQVGMGVNTSAKGPIGLVAIEGDAGADRLNKISLTFVPSTVRKPSSVESRPLTELTKAIQSIYKAVPASDPNFKFKRGSIQLQCTFKTTVGAGVKLVPLNLDVSENNQTVQSITLNFNATGVPEPEFDNVNSSGGS